MARKSAIAAAHNARVTDVHDTATLMQTQIMEYHRSTIDRRLQARLPPGSRNLAFFSPSLALTAADPIPPTPVPAQPQEAEALRAARLEERASKAKKFVERVDTVAEKNEERKARPRAPAAPRPPHQILGTPVTNDAPLSACSTRQISVPALFLVSVSGKFAPLPALLLTKPSLPRRDPPGSPRRADRA